MSYKEVLLDGLSLFAIDRECFKKTEIEKGKILSEKKKLPKSRNYKFTRQFIGAF